VTAIEHGIIGLVSDRRPDEEQFAEDDADMKKARAGLSL
jgi:hypothetical protein